MIYIFLVTHIYLFIGFIYSSIHFKATPKDFFKSDTEDKICMMLPLIFWPFVIVAYFLDKSE